MFTLDELEVQRRLHQQNLSLLFAETRSQPYQPAFYVAVDELNKTLILVIRGTRETSDFITDFDFGQKPFRGIKTPCAPDGNPFFVDAKGITQSIEELAKTNCKIAMEDPYLQLQLTALHQQIQSDSKLQLEMQKEEERLALTGSATSNKNDNINNTNSNTSLENNNNSNSNNKNKNRYIIIYYFVRN